MRSTSPWSCLAPPAAPQHEVQTENEDLLATQAAQERSCDQRMAKQPGNLTLCKAARPLVPGITYVHDVRAAPASHRHWVQIVTGWYGLCRWTSMYNYYLNAMDAIHSVSWALRSLSQQLKLQSSFIFMPKMVDPVLHERRTRAFPRAALSYTLRQSQRLICPSPSLCDAS